MTAIAKRKTKLSLETSAESRYRGKLRPIIVEPDAAGYSVSFRLKGTKIRYNLSWLGAFEYAAQIHARMEREERNRKRAEKKGRA